MRLRRTLPEATPDTVYSIVVWMAHSGPSKDVHKLQLRIRGLGLSALEPLLRAFHHRSPLVRWYAFQSLYGLPDARVDDIMLAIIEQPVYDRPVGIVAMAAEHLSRRGDRRALEPIRRWHLALERDFGHFYFVPESLPDHEENRIPFLAATAIPGLKRALKRLENTKDDG